MVASGKLYWAFIIFIPWLQVLATMLIYFYNYYFIDYLLIYLKIFYKGNPFRTRAPDFQGAVIYIITCYNYTIFTIIYYYLILQYITFSLHYIYTYYTL